VTPLPAKYRTATLIPDLQRRPKNKSFAFSIHSRFPLLTPIRRQALTRPQDGISVLPLSIRSFALKTVALLALATIPFAMAAEPLPLAPANSAARAATNVVLIVTTPSTIPYGEDVSGYAQVSSSDGSALTGTVTFFDGTTNICTIPATQTMSCPATAGTGFTVGTHTLTAAYSGDASHLGSTSNAALVVVVPDATTITLTSSANPSIYSQSIALTATAQAAHATPSGPVTFLDGSDVLGKATLNSSGVATFNTALLDPGSHAITATYAGDARTATASSAALAETVNMPSSTGLNPFTVTIAGSPTVYTGRAANLMITVAPQGGPIRPVQLSCTGLPVESICTFGTPMLPVNGGTTTLQITTMAPHSCEAATPSSSAAIPFAGPVLAGLMLLFVPRKKRKTIKGLLVAFVALGGLATLMGCGNCTDLGTRPGDYTINVVATSTASAAQVVVTKIVLHVAVP
jgi:hypothetical protein